VLQLGLTLLLIPGKATFAGDEILIAEFEHCVRVTKRCLVDSTERSSALMFP
jgi:hypothetical protein